MTIAHLLTVAGLAVLIAFIFFAFRQGTRVKPSGNPTWPNDTITGSDPGSSTGGHGGDSG
jgi:hypothetical protein